jgi:hypothetical protein
MHCSGVRHTNYDLFKHAFISQVIRSIKLHIIINICNMMSLFASLHNSKSRSSVTRRIANVQGIRSIGLFRYSCLELTFLWNLYSLCWYFRFILELGHDIFSSSADHLGDVNRKVYMVFTILVNIHRHVFLFKTQHFGYRILSPS